MDISINSPADEDLIAKFFSREVFSMLLHEGLINLELVQKILRWQHTGFNLHTKVRAKTRKDAERVGKYMIRPLLSLKRLSFDETEGKVCYQYEKDSSKQERMDYVEFIGRVTSHGVRLCYSWKPSSNTLFLDVHSQ